MIDGNLGEGIIECSMNIGQLSWGTSGSCGIRMCGHVDLLLFGYLECKNDVLHCQVERKFSASHNGIYIC